MKKLNYYVLVTCLCLMMSCKDNNKGVLTKDAKVTITTTKVPTFSDPKIQTYVSEYETYLNTYALAVENRDVKELTRLGKVGQDLAIRAQEISVDMSAADTEKFMAYITDKTKMIQEITSIMAED